MSVTRRLIAGPHRALGLVLGALAAVGCGSPTPTNPTPVCSFTLTSPGQSFSNDGGPGSVSVTTDAGCAWSVTGADGWVTLSSAASATGPGTVTYTVLPNTEPAARDKTLTVATQAYRISQDGRAPCAYAISPEQQQFSDEGGTGEVQVTAGADCGWTAKSAVPWLTIVAGASGRGPGTVTYKADPNNGTELRSGTLGVATRTVTVNQDGEGASQPANCQYSVTPVEFSPCMAGTRLTTNVVTQAHCQWTATAGAPWLSLRMGTAGAGAGTIAIEVPDNYDAPREGVIMVRWPTPTAGQNVRVQQAGCLYGVSQTAFSVTAAGGPASFTVVQESVPNTCGGPTQDRCVWSAQASVAWITIVSRMPMTGDNPVAFTVAANTGSAARTGRITVRDRVVTVTQAAP